jgi:hypothetical protein
MMHAAVFVVVDFFVELIASRATAFLDRVQPRDDFQIIAGGVGVEVPMDSQAEKQPIEVVIAVLHEKVEQAKPCRAGVRNCFKEFENDPCTNYGLQVADVLEDYLPRITW